MLEENQKDLKQRRTSKDSKEKMDWKDILAMIIAIFMNLIPLAIPILILLVVFLILYFIP